MNTEEHLLEVKRVTLKDVTESQLWTTLRLMDIVRIEQVDNVGAGYPDDSRERVYILTKYDGLFVLGNYKKLMEQWITYAQVNSFE